MAATSGSDSNGPETLDSILDILSLAARSANASAIAGNVQTVNLDVVTYSFAPDTKFAAIHLCNCSTGNLPDNLRLENGLSAHSSPVIMLTEMDKGRIGVDYAGAFEKSIALMASMPSQTAGLLDAESELMDQRAHMLLYGLFMQGVPQFWPGIITMGSKAGNQEPWANRIATMPPFYRHPDIQLFPVTVEALHLDVSRILWKKENGVTSC